jgi:prophage DNA circulation protein
MATTARDWLKTLWDASYKGVPFFVEKDNEAGSRRIVEHEFPMRDTPFLEDLGEGVRHFQLTAYVASDSADAEASAVMAICATRGPGMLVLPAHGPIFVRCLQFERDRSKDKHGYIAHSLNFSREGQSFSLISSAILSNVAFIAIDSLAVQVATTFAANLLTDLQPDFVIAAATDGLLDAVATVEAIRTTNPVEATVSSAQRNELATLYDAMPELVAEDPAQAASRIVTSMRAVAAAIDPVVAVQAFDQLIQSLPAAAAVIIPTDYRTPRRYSQAVNAEEAARVLRLATISAYCETVALVPLADRPAALTLRANVVEYLDAEVESMGAGEHDLYRGLVAVRDATVNYLSKAVLDLAPVRKVDANISMPSLYWSWRFYKDPNRAMEIVNRNRVAHPSFIPPQFEALTE